ncbi:hypothetical protein OG339_12815 [Streptosporangium sp. NBC_01495]|uniref:hypothetical protein n=1 Tax=Streptosporangium sp. NBC_01495 TaxID=2903899 RepID=UPI002E33078D|nr:hypothetical protein [Streptosporangium sp. NBC_01495]
MKYSAATVAGLVLTGVLTVPAQAATPPEAAYWRVEVIHTMDHPHPVGSGYTLTERSVIAEWLTPEGKMWNAFRKLGARPKSEKDRAAWKADGSPTSWTYRTEGMKISLSARPDKGYVGPSKGRRDGFDLGEGRNVTYQQLQSMPTDPAALLAYAVKDVRAWIDWAVEDAKTTSPNSKIDDWLVNLDQYVAEYMTRLLYRNPVPFKVRSAAYRALKTIKGVGDLGTVKDPLNRSGHGFALPTLRQKAQKAQKGQKDWKLDERFVVDTTTMTLLAHYVDSTHRGKSRVDTYKVGWTNDKPAIPAAG